MELDKKKNADKQDGVCAAIIHNKKILLLKRHWLPIIKNPSVWSLLFGGRAKGDTHTSTVYREIREETGLNRKNIKLISKPTVVKIFNTKNPSDQWRNHFYVFKSNSQKIKLDVENLGYRWASIGDIKRSRRYTNIFVDKEKVERLIERALNGR